MNKRGSHVGVIISFVIFVTFLVFLYIIIQPEISMKQDKTATLNSLKSELINNLSSNNATRVSVTIQESTLKNCILLVGFINLTKLNPNIIIYNETGNVYPSFISAGNNNDLYVNRTDTQSVFMTVYSSPGINSTTSATISPCNSLIQGNSANNYTIGEITNFSYAFDGDIINLIQDYNSDYFDTKNYFNLTGGNNFGFNFTYQNQTSIGTNDKISGFLNIYSQSFPITYITQNNTLSEGSLTIRVW